MIFYLLENYFTSQWKTEFLYFSGFKRALQKSLKFCPISHFIWQIFKWISLSIIIQFGHFRLWTAQLCLINQCHYRICLFINFTPCEPKYLFSWKKSGKCVEKNWVQYKKSLWIYVCGQMECLVCFGYLWKLSNWELYSVFVERY